MEWELTLRQNGNRAEIQGLMESVDLVELFEKLEELQKRVNGG